MNAIMEHLKRIYMKRILLLFVFLFILIQGYSQTKGISYQAVILNPNEQLIPGENAQGNILANSQVVIQFTIIGTSSNEEYQEYHATSTDKYGMINLLIGSGTVTSINNFSDIVWDGNSKKLQVAIDFSGSGSNYTPLSEQILSYMPQPSDDTTAQLIVDNTVNIFDERARATAAEQLNATDISTLQTEQTTQNEAIALNTAKSGITAAQAAIIAATSGTNTGDQDISGIATNATGISTLQTEQATQNTAIAVNTAKVGISPAQAAIIAATSGTNTGDQDISGIVTNATAISTLQTEQATQNTAIALNTSKVGITAQQASDITTNNAKVSDVNHVTSSTTDNLTEGITNLYYTEARVSANTAVAANTAKSGITAAQAVIIAATSGTNTGDQDISGIATNATGISTLQTEQATQNTAIALNTSKVGITVQQASDITANNAKVSDVNHVTSSTTDNLTEGTTNLYYTEARVSANTAVVANTAKTGITAAQVAIIAATSGTNTGDQDISGIATNTIGISTVQTEQTTQNTAIAINTAKVGISPAQAAIIAATSGTNTGDQDISGIATNTTDISTLQTEQSTQNTAIASNTTKTTNATHTGDATGAIALTVVGINGTSLASLQTGILKNTTTTGVPSIAVAGDFPTLNQNTTGTSANVTGTVAIANGGTGATTKAAGFDALSPMTAAGDIIYGGASGTGIVLPKGTANQVLTMNAGATAPAWKSATSASINGLSDGKTTSSSVFLGYRSGSADNLVSTNENTGLGIDALRTNDTGKKNTAIGYRTLYANSSGASAGDYNTAVGSSSLIANTSGGYNTALGAWSLKANIIGTHNTALGALALNKATGSSNVALGANTLYNNVTGAGNIAIGNSAGYNETGSNKLYIDNSNTTTPLIYGDFTTNLLRANGNLEISGTVKIEGGIPGVGKVLTSDANGLASWETNAVASIDGLSDGKNDGFSIFLGGGGNNDDGGNVNTAVGKSALASVTSGISNVAIGYSASGGTTTGSSNVAIGHFANLLNNSGSQNVVIGDEAGKSLGGGSGNILIGYQAGLNETVSNKLYIENSNSTTPLIYGEFDTNLVTINGALNLKNGTSAGNLAIYEASASGTNKVTIQTPALAADYTLTLPVDDGTLDQVLKTDGNGALSWTTPVSSNSNIFSLPVAMNLTVSSSDKYVICEVDGISITLPTAVGIAGKEYIIKNIAATNVTITTTSSQLIIQDAATKTTTATLGVTAQNNWIKVISDGTNWISFRALY